MSKNTKVMITIIILCALNNLPAQRETIDSTEYKSILTNVEDSSAAKLIIDYYIKAIGGRESLSKVYDKVMILKGATDGMEMTLTISQKKPNKLLQELDYSVGKQATVFNGEKGKIEGMGQVQYLEGEKLDELKYQAKLNSFLNYTDNGAKLNLEGIQNIEGKDAYRVLLISKKGKKYTHFYDVETGYKLREISELNTSRGTFKQIIDLSDYKEVNGIKYPFRMIQKIGSRTVELIVESIKINSGLDDSMFEVN